MTKQKSISVLASQINQFLGPWFAANAQNYPFRQHYDPYAIWISEIMLQQTQMQTVLPYFLKFMERFPSVAHLAEAQQEQIAPFWSGLGYYSRMRNLHQAAQIIFSKHGAQVPQSYEDLKNLPGIGDYTASAILGIAFNQAYYVVDGNVKRVLSRWFNLQVDLSDPKWHDRLKLFLQTYFPFNTPNSLMPRVFNQALMEYGAKICSPTPKCSICELNRHCLAFKNGTIDQNPWKSKTTNYQDLNVYALLLSDSHNRVWLEKKPLLFPWTLELASLPLLPSIHLPVSLQSPHYRLLNKELQSSWEALSQGLEKSPSSQNPGHEVLQFYQQISGLKQQSLASDKNFVFKGRSFLLHRITRFKIKVHLLHWQVKGLGQDSKNKKGDWVLASEAQKQGINQISAKIIKHFLANSG